MSKRIFYASKWPKNRWLNSSGVSTGSWKAAEGRVQDKKDRWRWQKMTRCSRWRWERWVERLMAAVCASSPSCRPTPGAGGSHDMKIMAEPSTYRAWASLISFQPLCFDMMKYALMARMDGGGVETREREEAVHKGNKKEGMMSCFEFESTSHLIFFVCVLLLKPLMF